MSIISRLFGSDKVLEGGMSLIDKAFYTSEEKAEDEVKRSGAKAALLSAYQPFKLAQRLVALTLAIPFVFIHVVSGLFWLILIAASFFAPGEVYDFAAAELAKVMDMNNKTLGEPVGWVVIFYFAGGAGEGVVKYFMRGKK